MTEQNEQLNEQEQLIDDKANELLEQDAREERAGKRLEIVFGKDDDFIEQDDSTSKQNDEEKDEQTDETESEDDSTSDKDEKTDESETESDSTSDSENDSEADKTDETGNKESKSKLTAAEVRAAIHCEWSEDEIRELEKVNPGLAKKTCAKFLETTNSLSKKFSELGKAQPKQEPEKKEPEKKETEKSTKIDFTALKKEYEDDPIVDILEQFAKQNETMTNELNELRSTRSTNEAKITESQAKEDAAIAQDIEEFFNGSDMADYVEVYGKTEKDSNWDNLTQKQVRDRLKVVEDANLILLGAQQQGIEMPVKEALSRASLMQTHEITAKVERNKLKAKTVKRQKAITFEPSSSKKIQGDGKLTRSQIEQKAGQDLQKVFG